MRITLLSALLLLAATNAGQAADVRILSAATMKAPLLAAQDMAPAATGSGLLLDFGTAGGVRDKMAAGASADLIACQPVAVTGRNYLWRDLIIQSIRGDPDWHDVAAIATGVASGSGDALEHDAEKSARVFGRRHALSYRSRSRSCLWIGSIQRHRELAGSGEIARRGDTHSRLRLQIDRRFIQGS